MYKGYIIKGQTDYICCGDNICAMGVHILLNKKNQVICIIKLEFDGSFGLYQGKEKVGSISIKKFNCSLTCGLLLESFDCSKNLFFYEIKFDKEFFPEEKLMILQMMSFLTCSNYENKDCCLWPAYNIISSCNHRGVNKIPKSDKLQDKLDSDYDEIIFFKNDKQLSSLDVLQEMRKMPNLALTGKTIDDIRNGITFDINK